MIEFTKEQVYIVTGASSGIGEGVALLLNELGATVVAIARNEVRLNEMKSKCQHPENMHIEIRDLGKDVETLPAYVKTLKGKYGKFYGMAYCAGVGSVVPFLSVEYKDMAEIFNINYFSPIMMTKGIADRHNNMGKGSSLVFLSSIAAQSYPRGQVDYAGAKAALSASLKVISKEVCASGIRVNSLLPSMIKTPMTVPEIGKIFHENKIEYPFGFGEVEDVANMVAFLLSDKSKFISGQNYILDSGGAL